MAYIVKAYTNRRAVPMTARRATVLAAAFSAKSLSQQVATISGRLCCCFGIPPPYPLSLPPSSLLECSAARRLDLRQRALNCSSSSSPMTECSVGLRRPGDPSWAHICAHTKCHTPVPYMERQSHVRQVRREDAVHLGRIRGVSLSQHSPALWKGSYLPSKHSRIRHGRTRAREHARTHAPLRERVPAHMVDWQEIG